MNSLGSKLFRILETKVLPEEFTTQMRHTNDIVYSINLNISELSNIQQDNGRMVLLPA